MNTDIIRKIYSENLNAEILLSFYQENYEIAKSTVRKKGQIKNQRFYCIKGGLAEFSLNNGEKIYANKGDILYFPPDITYKSKWLSNVDNCTVSIHFTLKSNDKELIISDNVFKVLTDKSGYIITLFDDIHRNFVNNNFGYKIKNKALLYDILHALMPYLYSVDVRNSNNCIHNAIIYIENNLFEDINVNNLAKSHDLSNSSFRQKFKEITGFSPIKYKNYLLIKKAQALLNSGEFTVTEVANQLKFYDVYYFSRLFKQYTGTSPNKFKNSKT